MVKTTLYLPDDLKQLIEQTARAEGRPEAEVIRERLAKGLADQPRRPRGQWGRYRGTGPSIARHVDDFLVNGFGTDGLSDDRV
ncbi:MAG: ribbon-helix-helix protein, CopG family [Mycobacteriales bacterium]